MIGTPLNCVKIIFKLMEKSAVVKSVQEETFPLYQKYEMSRLEKLAKCPFRGSAEEYYSCKDTITSKYASHQEKLRAQLLKADKEFDQKIKSCG